MNFLGVRGAALDYRIRVGATVRHKELCIRPVFGKERLHDGEGLFELAEVAHCFADAPLGYAGILVLTLVAVGKSAPAQRDQGRLCRLPPQSASSRYCYRASRANYGLCRW